MLVQVFKPHIDVSTTIGGFHQEQCLHCSPDGVASRLSQTCYFDWDVITTNQCLVLAEMKGLESCLFTTDIFKFHGFSSALNML